MTVVMLLNHFFLMLRAVGAGLHRHDPFIEAHVGVGQEAFLLLHQVFGLPFPRSSARHSRRKGLDVILVDQGVTRELVEDKGRVSGWLVFHEK